MSLRQQISQQQEPDEETPSEDEDAEDMEPEDEDQDWIANEEDDAETILEESDIDDMEVYISLDQITLPDLDSSDDSDDDIITGKRKRFVLTPTPPTTQTATPILDKSLSQLSISQKNLKKNKTIMTRNDQSKNENNELSTSYIEKLKPCYLKASDRIFKQMLSKAIDNGNKVVQCLDTPEKLNFVHQITEITDNIYVKRSYRQLWEEYHNISSKNINWQSKITKSYAHQHNTCRMYKPQKSFIEQRQKTIEHQLQQLSNELHEKLIKLQQGITQWKPPIDFEILSHMINECVKNGQQRLKQEFDHKKEMLTLNWTDHRLITQFYDLKPNEEVIQLAKQIWQATADELKIKEQHEILRQLIYLKRLPAKTEKVVNQLVSDNQITLSNPFLDSNQRASFASRCSRTIIQCKFNLMIVQLDEFESILRHHSLTLKNLQEQLQRLSKEKSIIYNQLIVDTIDQRQQAMIQRFYQIREYKLKTFFDEAPAVDSNL